MEASGLDSEGREFKNAEEMWRAEIGDGADPHKKTDWYRKGVGYWEGVEASVDGVLGGYGHVNDVDVKGSEAFLKTLFSERFVDAGRIQHLVALDCGSGIGRVTKNLLIRYFNEKIDFHVHASYPSPSHEHCLTAKGKLEKTSARACSSSKWSISIDALGPKTCHKKEQKILNLLQ